MLVPQEKQLQKTKQKLAQAKPQLATKPEKTGSPKRPNWLAPSIVLGAIAAAGIVTLTLFSGGSDDLSSADIQNIQQQYDAAVSAGQSAITPINFLDREERERAKAALGLYEEKAEELMLQAESGLISLGWVTVWDNYAEDGDVVEVSANGMTHRVPIMHEPTTIVVPYSLDNAQLTMTGIKDGGGGITVAAKTAAGSMPIPPMRPGQAIQLSFK